MHWQEDLALLETCAREAAAIALAHRQKGLILNHKVGGSPVTDADLASDQHLKTRLRLARPDYGWLSEETLDTPERLETDTLFIIDPIDGTSAFLKGKPWWSLSLAVVHKARPVAGVIYAPDLDELYSAALGGGAHCNGQIITPSTRQTLDQATGLADPMVFKRHTYLKPWPDDMTLLSRSSVAYRMAGVARGRYDFIFALSPKNEWDVAAGTLIAEEAGAKVGCMNGASYVFNRPSARLPDLICAAEPIYGQLLSQCIPLLDRPHPNP